MKGEVVGLFRQADGLGLPSKLDWDGLGELFGEVLTHKAASVEGFSSVGSGMRSWTQKFQGSPEADHTDDMAHHAEEEQEDEEGDDDGVKIILRNGIKADAALYDWYQDGRQVTRAPDQFVPKLPLGQQGTPSELDWAGAVDVRGMIAPWQPEPLLGPGVSVPADLQIDPEPSPAVRNPLLFVFRDGKAVARYRLVGATVKRLNPAAPADDGDVTLLTIVCKKLILTVRDA
jgi:hypothetical protein